VLQIEINRGLYMNEHTLEPHNGFERLSCDLAALAESLLAYSDVAAENRQAAE
jgi:N-formylglutamate amidohydrolase